MTFIIILSLFYNTEGATGGPTDSTTTDSNNPTDNPTNNPTNPPTDAPTDPPTDPPMTTTEEQGGENIAGLLIITKVPFLRLEHISFAANLENLILGAQ